MPNIELLVRPFQGRSVSPPRRVGGIRCSNDSPTTVVLELGKGVFGRVYSTGFTMDLQYYMTKQQREMEEDTE